MCRPKLFWTVGVALIFGAGVVTAEAACVWKVTDASGKTLYLGGSVHALRGTDYPLPAPYNQAFEAANRLAFEITPKDLDSSSNAISKAGEYPRGDNLHNHVDPRTYAYLKRFFGLLNVSEDKFSRYKPWFISLILTSPSLHGLSSELGVEEFLTSRARNNNKPIVGLESSREHMQVFAGMSDKQSEALLLLTFIPQHEGNHGRGDMIAAWRKGDADTLTRMVLDDYHDLPSFGERLLTARNRNWIPKIESYIHSGQVYFVVVGAGHMGGSQGVLALLRAKGYRVEKV